MKTLAVSEVTRNVLKGEEWHQYLLNNNFDKIIKHWDAQMKLYSGVTYKHEAILKIGDYYFVLKFRKGYKNIASLKKLL